MITCYEIKVLLMDKGTGVQSCLISLIFSPSIGRAGNGCSSTNIRGRRDSSFPLITE